METRTNLSIYPLPPPKRWHDFEALWGAHGAYGGCWCMWWRSARREFEERKGEGNRRALKAIVDGGQVPGILAYQTPPRKTPLAPLSSFMGLPAMFTRAGFVECARPSRSKVIMRCRVE